MKVRTRWYTFALATAGLLVLVLLLGAGIAHAKKPVKPPPPPAAEGWLYFSEQYGPNLWRMTADGTGLVLMTAALPDWPDSGTTHRDFSVSHAAYGGAYWIFHFDVIPGETYPDGMPRREIWASRIDGTKSVQLTNDPTFQFSIQGRIAVSKDDGRVAFNGIHAHGTDGDGNVVPAAAGIHAIDLLWVSGEPTVSVPRALLAPIEYWITTNSNPPKFAAPLRDLDWSGDGTRLVAGRVTAEGLGVWARVITPGPTGATELVLREASFPRWSPTTDRILLPESGIGISAIDADGTDYQVLVPRTTVRNTTYGVGLFSSWSPDGAQFAFIRNKTKRNGTTSTIAIYDVATGVVHDTGVTPASEFLLAWRPELP